LRGWVLRGWVLRGWVLRGWVLRGWVLREWVLRGWVLRGWLLPRDCFGVRCGVIHHFLTQNVCSNRLQGIRISQFLKLPSAACRGRLLSKFNSCDSWINTDGNDSSNRNFSSRRLSCNHFAALMTDSARKNRRQELRPS